MNDLINKENYQLATQPLSSFLERYIAYTDNSVQTDKTYLDNLHPFMKHLKDSNILNPTRKDVLDYKKKLISDGYTSNTINIRLAAIRSFFRWLDGENIYPNIAKDVKGQKTGRGYKKDPFTKEQVNHILSAYHPEGSEEFRRRNIAIFKLLVTTALRVGEVSKANVEDLRILQGETVLFIRGKGRDEKDDFVLVPPDTEASIRDYLRVRTSKSPALFCSSSNRSDDHMRPDTIGKIMKEMFRQAGLDSPRWTAHSLRHTAATIELQEGGKIEEVQQFLRHADINTSMRYAHLKNKLSSSSSSRVSAFLFHDSDEKTE